MGQCDEQFSFEERCTLSRLSQAGKTIRQIAASMDRSPSTIARELQRDRGTQVGYQPAYAEQQAKSRRWRGSRLLRDGDLQAEVLKRLGQGWSPAKVCGRLKKEKKHQVISHESIYRFIDAQIRCTNDFSWRHHCPGEKVSEGGVDTEAAVPSITSRDVSLSSSAQLTSTNADSQAIGKGISCCSLSTVRPFWSLMKDALACSSSVDNPARLPTLWLKLSRLCFVPCSSSCVGPSPSNGTEFAYHYRLHKLSMRTFFCDPHAPWQKGGIENAIGRMRRGLPRKTDLAMLSDDRLLGLLRSYNHTPRKGLNYKTPAEVFQHELSHLKCESTFPHAPE